MQYSTKCVCNVVKFKLLICLHGSSHHLGYFLGIKTDCFANFHAYHECMNNHDLIILPCNLLVLSIPKYLYKLLYMLRSTSFCINQDTQSLWETNTILICIFIDNFLWIKICHEYVVKWPGTDGTLQSKLCSIFQYSYCINESGRLNRR